MGHRRQEILKSIKPTLIFFAVAFGILAFVLYRAEKSPWNIGGEELQRFSDTIDQLYADNAVLNTYASTSSGQVHGMEYLNKCGRKYVVYDTNIDLENLQENLKIKPNIAYATIGSNESLGALRGDYSTGRTTCEPWLNYLRLIQKAVQGANWQTVNKSMLVADVSRNMVTDDGVQAVWAEEKILQISLSYDAYVKLWGEFGEGQKMLAENQLANIRPYIKDIQIVVWSDMTSERFAADIYARMKYKDDKGKGKETDKVLYTVYTAVLADPWEMDSVFAGPDTTREYDADSLYRVLVNDLQPVTGKINTTFREKGIGIQFNLLNAKALNSLGYVGDTRAK